MADIAGLISTIISFIDVGRKVVLRLNEFNTQIHDVPKTFHAIAIQIPLLIETLGRVERQASSGLINEGSADALRRLVADCLDQVNQLDGIFEKIFPSQQSPNWHKYRQALRSLTYDREIGRIVSELERHVQLLTFHQTTRNFDLSTRILMQGSEPVVPPSKPVFMVPFNQGTFVGREKVLSHVKRLLNAKRRRVALAGFGGVGKSQIAIECCYRYKAENVDSHVFWVHGSTFERFEQAYKAIARAVNLQGIDNPEIDILQAVAEWLSGDGNRPYLMVLDNADDPDVYFGAGTKTSLDRKEALRKRLVDYLSRSSNGSILITTRDKRVGARLADGEAPIVVLPMEPDEAKLLLKAKLPDNTTCREEDLTDLLKALDHLPLAITQATAYISEQEVSLEHYIALLGDDSDMKDLLEQEQYDPNRDAEIPSSLLQALMLSFDQITRRNPRAADILSLMAMLDRQSIMDGLVRKPGEGKVALDMAIGTLKAFSLITEGKTGAGFSMHRLVQLSTRWWLEKKDLLSGWQEKALEVIAEHCPEDDEFENWAQWEAIDPHVQMVLGYEPKTQPSALQKASILSKTAGYDISKGRHEAAIQKVRQALAIRQKLLGMEDVDTLTSKNDLADYLERYGQYEESECMHREVLTSRERILGIAHPDTLTTLNDLANVLSSQRKDEEAEQISRQILKLEGEKEEFPSPTFIGNLVSRLRNQGKWEEAEATMREALKLREEKLGRDHAETLLSMEYLADLLKEYDKYEEAENLYRQLLKSKEDVHGKEHPSTLTTLNDLADVLERSDQYEESERLHREVLAQREKLLGKKHPSTLATMNDLANVLNSQERYWEAEELHRQALVIHEAVWTKVHIYTLIITRNLALDLVKQGKWDEAERLTREAYELRRKELGEEHPVTLRSKDNLANLQERRREDSSKEPASMNNRATDTGLTPGFLAP